VVRVCGKNLPIPYSSTLEAAVIPGEEDLIAAVRGLLRI